MISPIYFLLVVVADLASIQV